MAGRRLLAAYHALPSPARSVAATLRGWYLKRWRYGAATARLVEEAAERDRWSERQWSAWQAERLGFVLRRAATQVPYYRAYWSARRSHGDRASWEVLENWPLLEKDTVRQFPLAFLADDCRTSRMFHEQTSGTTGTPLDIWRTRDTVRLLYAIAAARTRGWDGVPETARYARLGGQLVVPLGRREPPFWVWNAAMRQLYMSTYHLAPDLIPFYLEALRRHRIVYLAGYTSSLAALAQEALAGALRDLPMAVAYTNAEPLFPEQRAAIAAAFQCPVRETYGMAETVAAGSECPAGRLHLWPEVGLIEAGEEGELVCTGLLNADMPLVRYRVGDRGRLGGPTEPCPCGRSLPVLEAVDGRVTDELITPDGRRVFWLNPVFYGLPIRQSQIVQDRIDQVRVRIVPGPEFGPGDERTIAERLGQRLGDVRIVLERVTQVPRTANGKVRAVVCDLTADERDAALQGRRRVAVTQ